jgi:signal transduction histidine kinase
LPDKPSMLQGHYGCAPPGSAGAGSGFGLRSLAARVTELNGSLEVESAPGGTVAAVYAAPDYPRTGAVTG